uniref:Uncharacterized protein n=1 Tax=Lotharella oceanica TaxID=641309 RepID=A0A7S2TTT5_9EUKA|mmetsp:Transcript_27127/g.50618  ORF Transcript_27127/g.50618 Transcript_27127/m.50618 type:complete len:341 (+) Transcript_27127:54-1076(+)
MRKVRMNRDKKMSSIFLAIFCTGRSLESFAFFVTAAFFARYSANVVITNFAATLGAGLMLSILQDTLSILPRLRKEWHHVVINAILLSNSNLCSMAGLKYCGAYRYLLLSFLSHSVGPLTAYIFGSRGSQHPGSLKGSAVMLVALTALSMSTAYVEAQTPMGKVYGLPKAAVGFVLMLLSAVFEQLRMRYTKVLNVNKLGSSRSLHAVTVMMSAILQLPLALMLYALGYEATEFQMGTIPYLFMILFIMTYCIVFRFYITGVGKRISRKQRVVFTDFVVHVVVGSVLDFLRGLGDCTVFSTSFALAALLGLRLTLGKPKSSKDGLPFYDRPTKDGTQAAD